MINLKTALIEQPNGNNKKAWDRDDKEVSFSDKKLFTPVLE